MGLTIGERCPDFSLQGIDGENHELDDYEEFDALCIIFTCNHCPYVQAYEQRINELQEEFDQLQIACINSNDAQNYPEDGYGEMVRRAEDKGFLFEYLRDESQDIAHAFGATHTPECFLFNPDRELVYRGRIDDNWKNPSAVEEQSLRMAIEEVLLGDGITHALRPAIGCTIKWA